MGDCFGGNFKMYKVNFYLARYFHNCIENQIQALLLTWLLAMAQICGITKHL